MAINTATGRVEAADLGRTLMHEHLVVGMPGWQSDTRVPAPDFRNMVAACVDRVQELQAGGFTSMVDPCPSDLGRDPELIGEVAARTGFNIIFATGLYNEHHGGATYWSTVFRTDPDGEKRLRDVFVDEIENGVRGTGLKPGILKVGTAFPPFSDYEKGVFRAAAMASLATGTPITTHSEGVLGDEQLALLKSEGVPASRVIIGHCCGSEDHDYHMRIVNGGGFVGIDRFGIQRPLSDESRIASILKLKEKGALGSLIVSHDSVCCWLGAMLPTAIADYMREFANPMRFSRVIAPMLESAGVTAAEIETLLVDNPRRYFTPA